MKVHGMSCIQFHIFVELDEIPGLSSMAWLTRLHLKPAAFFVVNTYEGTL